MLLDNSEIGIEKIGNITNQGSINIYFIGIGGVSMSSLARLMMKRGHRVFGSDIKKSAITKSLSDEGADICYQQLGEHLRECAPRLCVYSLSADRENPDVLAALQLSVPLISRAELLGYVVSEYRSSFAISGSHGKSTVTALLTRIFAEAGKNPTSLLGCPGADGRCELIGSDSLLVYESCEYKNSFLKCFPRYQLILNLEKDHTDFFKSEEQLSLAFLACANQARDFAVMPYDSSALMQIREKTVSRTVTYGENESADYRYTVISNTGGRYEFRLFCGRMHIGDIKMAAPGRHNMENCVAAVVCAHHSGVKFSVCKRAAESFMPPGRRGQRLGSVCGAEIIYDYAHHPSEIRAALTALHEQGYKRICVVFCPHTYSRTQSFFNEFAEVLTLPLLSVVTDIFAAREKAIPGITQQSLADKINSLGGRGIYLPERQAFGHIKDMGFDCIVLMGAGNLDIIKEEIMDNCDFKY